MFHCCSRNLCTQAFTETLPLSAWPLQARRALDIQPGCLWCPTTLSAEDTLPSHPLLASCHLPFQAYFLFSPKESFTNLQQKSLPFKSLWFPLRVIPSMNFFTQWKMQTQKYIKTQKKDELAISSYPTYFMRKGTQEPAGRVRRGREKCWEKNKEDSIFKRVPCHILLNTYYGPSLFWELGI